MAIPVQSQSFSLFGSGVSLGDNVMTLVSFNDPNGVALSMANFGSKGFGTVEPGAGTQEEQISFTGVQVNPDGTRSLTGIKSVGFTSPFTETTGFAKSHAGGARFVISNTSGFYNDLASRSDNTTITGTWTFATSPLVPLPTTANQAVNKTYADSLAIAGAPDASDTTKGIAKLTVAPASPTNPIAVGANDVATTGASKVIRSKSNSKIDDALLGLTTAGDIVYSDGTDLQRLATGTAGQVLGTTGTAPAWQAIIPAIQTISLAGYDSTRPIHRLATASGSDSVIIAVRSGASTAPVVFRFAKEASGVYYQTHTVTLGVTGSAAATLVYPVIIGSFVYIPYINNSAAAVIRRLNLADLTSETAMTISGTAFVNTANGSPLAFTDGTDLYIHRNNATTSLDIYRHTISGTTATNAQTITFASTNFQPNNNAVLFSPGTTVYALSNSNNNGAVTNSIAKATISTGATVTTNTYGTFGAGFSNGGTTTLSGFLYSQGQFRLSQQSEITVNGGTSMATDVLFPITSF